MAVGRRIVEKLVQENYLGPYGHIAELEQHAREGLERLQQRHPDFVRSFSGIGAMWSLEPTRASLADIKALLHECYRNGLMLYYSGFGNDPHRLRMFLPGGVLTVDELNEALEILRLSLLQLYS
jgi:4-aminobutyrate aminotransferase-like enzyme